jgi:hypothetical protein
MHTKGPWYRDGFNVHAQGGGRVAEIISPRYHESGAANEGEAFDNAYLVSRAPTLHEALDEALTWWHSDERNFERQEPEWLAHARLALGQAAQS